MNVFPVFFSRLSLLIYATLVANFSLAAEPLSNSPHWQFALGLGYGVRTNPVMDNGDIPLVLLPFVSYQNGNFFLQNLDMGYKFFEAENQQISLLLTPSYDQVFFHRWDIGNFVADTGFTNATISYGPELQQKSVSIDKHKLHERRMAALGGFEYTAHADTLEMQIQALHELTQYYEGDELRIAVSKNIDFNRSQIKLTLGANWQSNKTLDYFYGLDNSEAKPVATYKPDAGLSGLTRFDWNYQLDEHWNLHFFASYRYLSDEITRSPLITNNKVITAFAGGVYHF